MPTRPRAAQTEWVTRLDAAARGLIRARVASRKRFKGGGTRDDQVTGAFAPSMTMWRTDADLRCWDTFIDPSGR